MSSQSAFGRSRGADDLALDAKLCEQANCDPRTRPGSHAEGRRPRPAHPGARRPRRPQALARADSPAFMPGRIGRAGPAGPASSSFNKESSRVGALGDYAGYFAGAAP